MFYFAFHDYKNPGNPVGHRRHVTPDLVTLAKRKGLHMSSVYIARTNLSSHINSCERAFNGNCTPDVLAFRTDVNGSYLSASLGTWQAIHGSTEVKRLIAYYLLYPAA